MNRNLRVVIPAAGRSSRSGLNYPKCLYKLGDLPIIARLYRTLSIYDASPLVIINPDHKELFEKAFDEKGIRAEFVFQNEPLGMGHALLQADNLLPYDMDIILAWSDIPLLSNLTVTQLVNCHMMAENDFSFATSLCESCYTIVTREKGSVKAVIETRAAGIPPGRNGERDIGLFIFKKGPVFSLLQQHQEFTEVNGKKEQGFLYIIEKLAASGKKVEGYPIAKASDLLSFNTPEDLRLIEASPELRSGD